MKNKKKVRKEFVEINTFSWFILSRNLKGKKLYQKFFLLEEEEARAKHSYIES